MKRIIQWSIDHHWLVIGLSVLLLAAGAWTARRAAGRRLSGPDCADGHDPDRRPRDGPRRDGIARHLPHRKRHQRRVGGAPRAFRDGRRRSPWSGSSSIGAPTSSWPGSSSLKSCRSSSGTLPPQVERPVLAPVSSIMGEILFFASPRSMTIRWRCERWPTRRCVGGCLPSPASRRSRRSEGPNGNSRSSRTLRRSAPTASR